MVMLHLSGAIKGSMETVTKVPEGKSFLAREQWLQKPCDDNMQSELEEICVWGLVTD